MRQFYASLVATFRALEELLDAPWSWLDDHDWFNVDIDGNGNLYRCFVCGSLRMRRLGTLARPWDRCTSRNAIKRARREPRAMSYREELKRAAALPRVREPGQLPRELCGWCDGTDTCTMPGGCRTSHVTMVSHAPRTDPIRKPRLVWRRLRG